MSQRLQDRREVAAGTRAQVLGFEDGRFYANGWHTTGEMGGIITPPLKLLDSLYLGVNDQWVGPATRFTSGWGYMRYALPPIDGIGLERTDVAPDGRRGALIGLKLTNPKKNRKRVNVMVDAHSELMTQYPWGFGGTVPNASDNAADSGAFDNGSLVFRDTGRATGRDRQPLLHGDRRLRPRSRERRRPGPATTARSARAAAVPADQTPAPMPSECDDGPFGRGTGGRLHYHVDVPGSGSTTLWIAVAGSENSVGEARSEFAALTADPAGLLAEKKASRQALARWSKLTLPGDSAAAGLDRVGQAEPRRPHAGREGRRHPLDQPGQGVDARGLACRSMRWIGAGFPDYPWLFGVDGEYTAHAAVTLGQFDADQGPHAGAARHLRHPQRRLGRGRARGRRRRLGLVRQGLAPHQPGRARSATTSTRTRSSSSRAPWR